MFSLASKNKILLIIKKCSLLLWEDVVTEHFRISKNNANRGNGNLPVFLSGKLYQFG